MYSLIDQMFQIGNIDNANYYSPEYIPGIWVLELIFLCIVSYIALTIIHYVTKFIRRKWK